MRPDQTRRRAAVLAWTCVAAAWVGAACASGGRPGPAGAGPAAARGALPPVPRVTGPIALRVVYPDSLARIAVRDSNFLLGTTGTGDAGLTIDGIPVSVEPNGAFLAWLPVPDTVAGDTAEYVLVARREGRADTLRWPVLLPARPYRGEGAAWIDTAALRDRPLRWARPDEELVLSVRGAPGEEAWLSAGRRRYRLREVSPGRYELRVPARAFYAAGRETGPDSTMSPRVKPAGRDGGRSAEDTAAVPGAPGAVGGTPGPGSAPLDSIAYGVELVAAGDTARASARYPLRLVDPAAPPVAELIEAPDTVNGRADVVVGRPLPSGPYLWRFPDRTVAAVDGRLGDRLRLRLGPALEAWADTADARFLPEGTPTPTARAGDIRIVPETDELSVSIPLGDRVPVRVRTEGSRLTLTLYDTRGRTNRLAYGPRDPLLVAASWDQLTERRWRLELSLAAPVWGWRLSWEGGGDAPPADSAGAPAHRIATGGTLHLEIRRPPRIDPDHPLRGRTIAVDPGHPPAGAHGPTGLYEGDANLAVARAAPGGRRHARARPTRHAVRWTVRAGAPGRLGRRRAVRVPAPERASRWRSAVRGVGDEHVLLPGNLSRAGGGRAGGSAALPGPAGPGNRVGGPRRGAPELDARGARRGSVHHDAETGGGAAHGGFPGVLRAWRAGWPACLPAHPGPETIRGGEVMRLEDLTTRERPRVPESAFVAPSADVIGDVELGEETSVWYQCVLRGDIAPIRVGARSNIQDLTMVHVDVDMPCLIGDRVGIGHRAIIHGCRIEDDCLIGMGAVVLSGAVIGGGSLVAAGAVVTEGMEVPPDSLVVGLPARIIRTVDGRLRERMRQTVEHYRLLKEGHRGGRWTPV